MAAIYLLLDFTIACTGLFHMVQLFIKRWLGEMPEGERYQRLMNEQGTNEAAAGL